jgi:hypothetical protein
MPNPNKNEEEKIYMKNKTLSHPPKTLNQGLEIKLDFKNKLVSFQFVHYLKNGPNSGFFVFETLKLGVDSQSNSWNLT